jgi:hypothetical protein
MRDVDSPFTAEPCQICFLEMREQSFERSREGFIFINAFPLSKVRRNMGGELVEAECDVDVVLNSIRSNKY